MPPELLSHTEAEALCYGVGERRSSHVSFFFSLGGCSFLSRCILSFSSTCCQDYWSTASLSPCFHEGGNGFLSYSGIYVKMAARDSGIETWDPLLPWAPDELTSIWRVPWTQPWGPEHTRPVQPAPLQSPNFRAIETVSAAAGGSKALPGASRQVVLRVLWGPDALQVPPASASLPCRGRALPEATPQDP